MISHEEAQALISARMDGPLDPAANRALLAHLATCPGCRRFAEQTNILARGLRDLPHYPPSPTVSRVVLERISEGRSPWTGFFQWMQPARLATVATALVLLFIGIVAANQLLLDSDDGRDDFRAATDVTAPAGEGDLAQARTEEAPTATQPATEPTQPAPEPTPATERETVAPGEAATERETVAPGEAATDESAAAGGAESATGLTQTEPPPPSELTGEGTEAAATRPAVVLTLPTETTTASQPDGGVAAPGETPPVETGAEPTAGATATAEPGEAPPATEPGEDEEGGEVIAAFAVADGTPLGVASPAAEASATTAATATTAPTATSTATPRPSSPATLTPAPTSTATATPTATATATPEPTSTPPPTATATATATPRPTSTATPSPTATPEPTATSVPTETPVPTATPTATATATPVPTETPAPTETPEPTATPVPTETLVPTATATPVPTATPLPTETPVPTETPTPTETPLPTETPQPTETPEPTETPVPTPTATESAPTIRSVASPETPESGAGAAGSDAVGDDEVGANVTLVEEETPLPTEEAGEETPTAEPTPEATAEAVATFAGCGVPICPQDTVEAGEEDAGEGAGGESADTGEPVAETSEADLTAEATSEAAIIAGDGEDGTETGGEQDATTLGGEATETAATEGAATADADAESAEIPCEDCGGADLPEVETVIPATGGVATAPGPLRVLASGVLVSVDGEGVQLMLVTYDGAQYGLGAVYYPIVHPGTDQVLVAYYGSGSDLSVGIWHPDTGLVSLTEQDPSLPSYRDVPAGWENGVPYYQRTYADGPVVELWRSGDGEDQLVWTRSGLEVFTRQPIPVPAGFLLATSEGWLLIGADGSETPLGGGVPGDVSAWAVSADGTLLAYASGGVLNIAPVGAPGWIQAQIPYNEIAGNGFDFSPSGQFIAVVSGPDLTIYDTVGGPVTSIPAPDSGAFAAPYWLPDGILVPSGDRLVRIPPTLLPGG